MKSRRLISPSTNVSGPRQAGQIIANCSFAYQALATVNPGETAANTSLSANNIARLFDQLVGAQKEIPANLQSEGPRCREIDNKFEFDGLLNRQVGRLCPLR